MMSTPAADLRFRPLAADDAEMILRWRTDPEITRFMVTDVEYDVEKQRQWIERSAARTDFVHRIMCVKDRPVGYASVTVTDPVERVGAIGLYVGEPDVPRIVTAFNFLPILNHAFYAMGLNKLANQVLGINDRVLKAQSFNGYRHVGVLPDHVVKDGRTIDVHLFEQTRDEWSRFRMRYKHWQDMDGRLWPPETVLTRENTLAG